MISIAQATLLAVLGSGTSSLPVQQPVNPVVFDASALVQPNGGSQTFMMAAAKKAPGNPKVRARTDQSVDSSHKIELKGASKDSTQIKRDAASTAHKTTAIK